MNPAIDKLTKYLRLETKRGFDNRAVLGGLDRMLEPWKDMAQESGLPDSVVQDVVSSLQDYGSLPINARQEVLQSLWGRLQEANPDLGEAPSAPTKAPSKRPKKADQEAVPAAEHSPAKKPPSKARGKGEGKAPPTTPSPPAPEAPAALGAALTAIPGVGSKTAGTLKKLALHTLGDLLWHLPRRYDDYSQLKTINRLWYGEEVTIIGTVEEVNLRPVRSGKIKLVEVVISDGTGALRVTWFNQAWIANRLKPGRAVVLSGKVDQYLGRLTMNNPEWEPLERRQLHTNRIVPVYPLTAGITAKWLRRVMNSVVTRLAPRVPDPLPPSIVESDKLLPLPKALEQVHFPDDWETLRQAQHRLAFDEMFMLQLGVMRQKHEWEQLTTAPLEVEDDWLTHFQTALPYQLTKAQRKALHDVRSDLAGPRPMNRLLQGEVGSGKTVIAAGAVGIVAAGGGQSALMAPTSILAEQHFRNMQELLPSAASIPQQAIRLLIGATPAKEKSEIRKGLEQGSIQVVVGTHALLEDPVSFSRLALAIIDEQHRFGVEQRAVLRSKGENPNLLVMTATPIPRSLALTIYGDLDLTVIDELPPGRQPVETRVLQPIERNRAYSFINGQLEAGRQAFIIYPLVEDSEKMEGKSAVEEQQRLKQEVFPSYEVGLLHGRLKADEKEEVMSRFRASDIQVLVSTSVVEVGVDIPNATVMMIEGANHFGLAQLHQFRGRVGRGSEKSYCLLISDSDDQTANERLAAMEKTDDGFELAELDLKQRGPGDFLGTRQSGFAELRTAKLSDIRLIEKARKHAQRLFSADPELDQPEHALLAEAVSRFWTEGKGEIS
ncbi:MAG: ATP-dependent DNA helicase RecG [Anaerolineales bacterium]|jgi:ATP-dependent DNA helicase RecG